MSKNVSQIELNKFIKINPLNAIQQEYISSIEQNIITLVLGFAGTGKSWISAMMALKLLLNEKYKKVIITRPLIECGEKLGFLPGELIEKVTPYMMPILDIMYNALGKNEINKLIHNDIIEICPLAYMRGRSFSHTLIVADEMQNATMTQIKMLLTRIAKDSKMILNGDATQSDLFNGVTPFEQCFDRLSGLQDIGTIEFFEEDIVRHNIIGKILDRLEGS